MTPMNLDLISETMDKINLNEFEWEQGNWVSSDRVLDGTDVALFNECGTAYCFAGYVAARERIQLFEELYDGSYLATDRFVPNEGDPESDGYYTRLYKQVVRDEKVYFEEYKGTSVSARSAAIFDLNISEHVADVLFDGDNTLEHLEGVVNTLHAIR